MEYSNETSLDLSSFRWIESQTTERDRLALLSLRETICTAAGSYNYLEVGSHLGGSLQPHVIDARCAKIVSIDPRPAEQPDERWTHKYKYDGNSTERMLKLLSAIPNADIGKIRTIEACSWELSPTSIPEKIDFAFIDGIEHTNKAVIRDFKAVRRFLSPVAMLAFHDCGATPDAFLDISRILRRERGDHSLHHFPDSNVVAIGFGSPRLKELLNGFGWQTGFPEMHGKTFLERHFPRLSSVVKSMRLRN